MLKINILDQKLKLHLDIADVKIFCSTIEKSCRLLEYSGVFVHDGPPYANGKIHIGTFLNKSIKDFVVRSNIVLGAKVCFIPGWDCHGLPIENKVLEYCSNNNIKLFRIACEKYAEETLQTQREQMEQSGFLLDVEHYATKSRKYIANTLETLFNLVCRGIISRRLRPNYYSFEDKTNLAFSEIEYASVQHHSIFFKIQITNTDMFLLVWTTQPWTILANQFICINSEIEYVIFDDGAQHIIASKHYVLNNKIDNYRRIDLVWLSKRNYKIPFSKEIGKVIIDNDLVGDEGTGIVHCAPAHGFQDYDALVRNFENYESMICNCVDENGFTLHKELKQLSIVNGEANNAVINRLYQAGMILQETTIVHSYPISWRSKKTSLYSFYSTSGIVYI